MPTAQARTRPRRLGSFEVIEEIGQGGMGIVYLARQPALERLVVLKRMQRDLLLDPSMVERFEREARAAAAVHHQNVVAVYDCFTIRGDHYIAGEYVDGPDLRSVLDQCKRLEPKIAALIALEVMRGLEEVHARGIVHRDLKPGNVLIGCGGETKIADFGIALDGKAFGLTRPGTLVGSVPYLSPEQLLGERVDYRSDLFVFGILLYEMITGVPPFEESEEDAEDTLLERMQDGRYVAPRRRVSGVPRYLARAVRACLQARPAKRVATATDLRRQLERGLGRISPADCRRRIAAWLWDRGLVQPATEGQTELRPAAVAPTGVWRRVLQRPSARWLVPGTIALALIGMGLAGNAMGLFSSGATESDPPRSPAPARVRQTPQPALAGLDHGIERPATTPPVAPRVVPVQPARVRFAAWPWAEVRIEGQDSFLTPRALPLELAPGAHTITFAHPTYGEARYEIELAAGDERTLTHVFEQAPAP